MSRTKIVSADPHGLRQRGLYTSLKISARDVIASEKPVLSITYGDQRKSAKKLQQAFFDSVKTLSTADLIHLKNLSFRHKDFVLTPEIKNFIDYAKQRIPTTNAFARLAIHTFVKYSIPFVDEDEPSGAYRLFREFPYLNHFCKPNAALYWEEQTGKMVLRATSEIQQGEEILISYVADPFQEKATRHTKLGFKCGCVVCASEEGIVDEIRYTHLRECLRIIKDVQKTLKVDKLPDDLRRADQAQISAILEVAAGGVVETIKRAARAHQQTRGAARKTRSSI